MKQQLLLSFLAAVSLPLSAGSLQEDARAAGCDWLIGSWGDQATQGATLKISYEWRLDGHMVAVKLATADREAEGIISRPSGSEEIHYFAVDNKGGDATGRVNVDDGRVIISTEFTDAANNRGRATFIHEKSDAKTVKVAVQLGDIAGNPLGETFHLVLVRLP